MEKSEKVKELQSEAEKLGIFIRDLKMGADEGGIAGELLDNAIAHLEEAEDSILRCAEEYVLAGHSDE